MSLRRSALKAIHEHDQNTCRVRERLANTPEERIASLAHFLANPPCSIVSDLALWAINELYYKDLAEKDAES